MSMTELLLILAIGLVVLGPERLPALARGLGRAMREFRRATREIQTTLHVEEVRRTLKERIDLDEANGGQTPTEVTTVGKGAKPPAPAAPHDPDQVILDPAEGALPYRHPAGAEVDAVKQEPGTQGRLSPLPPPAAGSEKVSDPAGAEADGTEHSGGDPKAGADSPSRAPTSSRRPAPDPTEKPADNKVDDTGPEGG
jgi:TatA/E family protein of Tat protein translocase